MSIAEDKSITNYYGMPDIDGYELVRRLRARPVSDKATIIAHTGYGQPNDRSLGKNAGFDHYFVKPVDIEKLARVPANKLSG